MLYKVLNQRSIHLDLVGLCLEFVGFHSFYGVILRQPEYDNRGWICPANGLVVLDHEDVQLVRETFA